MEILGIGLPELVFIFVIALLILGPRDMQKTARKVGLWLNRLINSDVWKAYKNSPLDVSNLHLKLMREANLDLKKTDEEIRRELRSNPRLSRHVPQGERNRIDPVSSNDSNDPGLQSPGNDNKETEREIPGDG